MGLHPTFCSYVPSFIYLGAGEERGENEYLKRLFHSNHTFSLIMSNTMRV